LTFSTRKGLVGVGSVSGAFGESAKTVVTDRHDLIVRVPEHDVTGGVDDGDSVLDPNVSNWRQVRDAKKKSPHHDAVMVNDGIHV